MNIRLIFSNFLSRSKIQVVDVEVLIFVEAVPTSFNLNATGARGTISLSNLLQQVDQLGLSDLALKNSSLRILQDDVLEALRFLRLYRGYVSESYACLLRKNLLHHCLFLLMHRCFLFLHGCSLLHLLLHLGSLLLVHCHFY